MEKSERSRMRRLGFLSRNNQPKPSTKASLLENLVLGLAIGLFIVAVVVIITLATGGFGSPLALILGGIGAKLALGALGGTAAFWIGLTALSMGIVAVCTGLSGLATKLFNNCSPQNEAIANTNSFKIVNNPYMRTEFQPVAKSSQSGEACGKFMGFTQLFAKQTSNIEEIDRPNTAVQP